MHHFRVVLAALAVLCLAVGSASAKETCISDWSIAAPIVHKKGLATVEKVARLARDHIDGNIVKTSLCKTDDTYTYKLVIRTPSGKVKVQYVDAVKPFSRFGAKQ